MGDFDALPIDDGESVTFMATIPKAAAEEVSTMADFYGVQPSVLILLAIQTAFAPHNAYELAGRAFGVHLEVQLAQAKAATEAAEEDGAD